VGKGRVCLLGLFVIVKRFEACNKIQRLTVHCMASLAQTGDCRVVPRVHAVPPAHHVDLCACVVSAGLTSAMHCKDPGHVPGSSSSNSGGQYAAELYGMSKVFKGGPTPLSCRPAFMCKPCMTAHAHEDADEDRLLQAVTAGANSSSSSSRRGRGSSGGHQKRDDFWALRGTWLGIERGRLFCLLGPNGAGKTTTINCLTGGEGVGGREVIWGGDCGLRGGISVYGGGVGPMLQCCSAYWGPWCWQHHYHQLDHR
jgi:hypothetical protein